MCSENVPTTPEGDPRQFTAMSLLKPPTAAGAIENSDLFRYAASRAWERIGDGQQRAESAFSYGRDNTVTDLGKEPDEIDRGHMRLLVPSDSFALLHTHNNRLNPKPSAEDIRSAQSFGHPVYVMSRDGLYLIRPSDGAVERVYQGLDWTNPQ
jgi:hypothetical protein